MKHVFFWLSVAVPLYAYVGYPILLVLLRLVVRRDIAKHPIEPTVSMVIPAFNEADVIERKIADSLALDYPRSKLEILVASDGSTDGTAERARRMADGTLVRVLDFPENLGKICVLNAAVKQLHGEIIVFSDASAMLRRDAVRNLVSNFADKTVGAVSGRYTVVSAGEDHAGTSEDLYWRYETFLKAQESGISSTLGGHGHLHAIRAALYPFPPSSTINDDYVIPVSVLSKGYRAVYDPAAIVYEEAREMAGFGRRVRIAVGNVQQLREIRSLIWPLRPGPLFFALSHKFVRIAVPFAMIGGLAANVSLIGEPLYVGTLVAQAVFYGLAAIGGVRGLRPRLLRVPYYFCMINLAALVAAFLLFTRRQVAWK